MTPTPWYKVAVPRADLRRGEPLEASQFAVHLDMVASASGPPEYVEAELFLERTFITEGLRRFAAEVLRRLAGERQASSAVLNLTTQFGGGKTHALTLLYHLARLGPAASGLPGIADLLDAARLAEVPEAAVAVFVGTDWDAVEGRGAGTQDPRRTPWGDIAWQLAEQTGQPALYEAIREQDAARVRPGKDVIRKILPQDRPVLILMDEVMNFMTAARAVTVGGSTLASQFYEFVHSLTEVADSCEGLAVVVSLPKSEQEMSAEDEQDFQRLGKVTTRVARSYVLAKDLEVPEIVRRRLFESTGESKEVRATARAYARWIQDHRDQIPRWFPIDDAEAAFMASYPFHPTVLSVFERKWQALPSFQRTRGILQLLAQWVADAYDEGLKGVHRSPVITLGSAPLDNQMFRTAVLDQIGEERLAAAVISDIAGQNAHAERLDQEATETQRKQRIHRNVATTIFFESSGGQVRQEATVPELRLAVGGPGFDVGNVETALEALQEACYFLEWTGNRYRFSTKPNLNKLLADRRSALDPQDVEEEARSAIRRVFGSAKGVDASLEPVFFPDDSASIPDGQALRLIVLAPDRAASPETRSFVAEATKDRGAAPRVYRNALVWCMPTGEQNILDAARRSLAWRTIADEAPGQDFDDAQLEQLEQHSKRAREELTDSVWRSYRLLAFLGSDGSVKEEDLGLSDSGSVPSAQALIQLRLKQRDELTESLAPTRVVQNWPKGRSEWSTRALRDAIYASPAFTRLLRLDALRDTIAAGVQGGDFGYAAKRDSDFVDIKFEEPLAAAGVEFSDDVVLVQRDLAAQLQVARPSPAAPVPSSDKEAPLTVTPVTGAETASEATVSSSHSVSGLRWEGVVPAQKWTTFYTKVLSGLQSQGDLNLRVAFESRPARGLTPDRVEQTRLSLEELDIAGKVELLDGDDTDAS